MTAEELQSITGLRIGATGARLLESLQELAKNPEFVIYKFKNTAYKFSFMLIPISLPVLWLMFFWRKNVTAYDHIVFSLYSLSFMSLLFIVMALMTASAFTSRFIDYLLLVPPSTCLSNCARRMPCGPGLRCGERLHC